MANWTGNAYVDALLLGEKWDTNNFTYFLKGGSSTWNAIETAAMQAAMQSWADVANIGFTRIFIEAQADFVEDQTIDVANSLGVHTIHQDYASTTIATNGAQLNGLFNSNGFGWDESDANGGLSVGGLGYLTILHEIGHGLGLDHTHDDGGGNVNFFPGVSNSADSGNNNLNQDIYSVMSYVHGDIGKFIDGGASADNYGFVAGPMAFDIATIQYLYGANTTKNSGDNTYVIADTDGLGTYFSAIWDVGGIDEIVYQGSKDTSIDLRSATLADEDGGGGFLSQASGITGGFVIAADFTNALTDVNGETGVIIENASGGSGIDLITGNEVANVLNGNAGADIINAGGGNDTINGGTGNDIISGEGDSDTVNGDDGADHLSGNAGADTIVGGYDNDKIFGGAGADIIYGDKLDGTGRAAGASGISIGTGQINKSGGNISIATAQDISSEFSLGSDAEIDNANTIPHVSVLGTGDGNVDYYKITLVNSNVTITVDVDHGNEGAAPAAFDAEVSIYFANGSLVKNNDDAASLDTGSTSIRDPHLTHTFADAGTYYIAIGKFASFSTDPVNIATGGTYELQVSVSGEIVNNNDEISGGADNDIIHASVGNDSINGGTGIDTYDFSHDTQGAVIDLRQFENNAVGTGIGSDSLSEIEVVIAGSGNDSLRSDLQVQTFYGGSGDDVLDGGVASDQLYGEAGNDRLNITAANAGDVDILDGGAGVDTAHFAGFSYAVWADLSFSSVNAQTRDGSDLSSGAWRDIGSLRQIENLGGTDFSDALYGDAGDNIFYYYASDFAVGGFDSFGGGDGADRVSFAQAAFAVWADLSFSSYNAQTRDGSDLSSGNWRDIGSLSQIENLEGSDFSDALYGDDGDNILYYYSSGFGQGGFDNLGGGGGTDLVSFEDAAFAVWADLNFSSYNAQTRDASDLSSGAWRDIGSLSQIENLEGSDFSDQLYGNAGDNVLYYYASGFGQGGFDNLGGGGGTDRVSFEDAAFAVWADLNFSSYNAQTRDATDLSSGAWRDIGSLSQIENLGGSDFSDQLYGNAGDNVLYYYSSGFGQGGFDNLGGGGGTDLVSFEDAAFAIWADLSFTSYNAQTRDGSDLSSGTWRDIGSLSQIENLGGSDFSDQLYGNSGDNILYYYASDFGQGGFDNLGGGGGTDLASFKDAAFAVWADLSFSSFNAQTRDKVDLSSGAWRDIGSLSAIEGLEGSAFNDSLSGNSGVNYLSGGGGLDVLYGADGSDIFGFTTGFGNDIVSDFQDGGAFEDVLDLSQNDLVNSMANITDIDYTTGSAVITTSDGLITLTGVTSGIEVSDFLF